MTASPSILLSSTNPFDVPVHFDLPEDRAIQAAPVQGFGSVPASVPPGVVVPDRVRGKVFVTGHTLDANNFATNGDAARAALGRGVFLPGAAEQQRQTLGASLLLNQATRFSGLYGRPAQALESFELATPDGKRRMVRRPDAHTSTENDALFHAVPGGFGFLGAVMRLRMELPMLPANLSWTTPRVETIPSLLNRHGALIDALVHDHVRASEGSIWGTHRAVAEGFATWALMGQEGGGIVFRSELVAGDRPLRPFTLHQPDSMLGRASRYLSFSSLATRLGWKLLRTLIARRDVNFVDSYDGFTFRQEGAWRASERLSRIAASAWAGRQSFVLPIRRNDAEPGKRVKQFVEQACQTLEEANLRTNPLELVALPADESLLSASRGMEGIQVTFASRGLSENRGIRFAQVMRRLSRTCADLGGRVQLEKSVSVEPHVLNQMYGNVLEQLRDLKAEFDPAGVLRNAFVERLLKT